VFQRVFPNFRFVWVRREDVISQAVSWWKAIQSGQWWSGQEAASEPVYGFEQIDWLVNEIRVYEGCWYRWFQAERIDPIIVGYADLCADHEGVTLGVLDALGLEPVVGARIAPMDGLTRQADEISAEWVARYEEEQRERTKA
jgi:LPS sulfotransferase NodH